MILKIQAEEFYLRFNGYFNADTLRGDQAYKRVECANKFWSL